MFFLYDNDLICDDLSVYKKCQNEKLHEHLQDIKFLADQVKKKLLKSATPGIVVCVWTYFLFTKLNIFV